ncbi:HK97 family phage prohead protease [Rhodococcus sp. ACPA1]|uniref:HK97 family phage prohead protease n=1 Tax=Rhodococcus sp. ACPA1 TaxID=2028572 RepID=UPI000BB0FB49|nr:HK97 family phage prohead protease [Rhodococcus sp. ACPA1]PBC57034.1 HK97 family phage prohead protease [Rhodococcus sp. ACPA1]
MIIRTSACDLDIRIPGDGRTVHGVCVPFDSPALINDRDGRYSETFTRGSFARTIRERGAGRVKFLALHDQRALPLGRATLLREDATGLYGEFRVSQTQSGDEALELVRDGALDAFSIGFEPVRNVWAKDMASVVRAEAKLLEVSVVAFPAFDGAAIAGVRHREPSLTIPNDIARRRLAVPLETW